MFIQLKKDLIMIYIYAKEIYSYFRIIDYLSQSHGQLRKMDMISYNFTNQITDQETCLYLIEKEQCTTFYHFPENDCVTEYKAIPKLKILVLPIIFHL